MNNIFEEIRKERERQDEKWGQQDHNPIIWSGILTEEVGEVAQAALEDLFNDFGDHDSDDYREELIQCAAVCVAAIQCLDRSGTDELDSHLQEWKPLGVDGNWFVSETYIPYEVITKSGKVYKGYAMDWGFVPKNEDEKTLEEMGEEIVFFREIEE